jgi:hypothetical protein
MSKLTKEEGLRQIEDAKWTKGRHGELGLAVRTQDGRPVLAWLELRPHYCDRGHIKLLIEGIADLDGQDNFPRYFFSFPEADHHTRVFLKWRLWKERTYPHTLEAP